MQAGGGGEWLVFPPEKKGNLHRGMLSTAIAESYDFVFPTAEILEHENLSGCVA